MASNEDRPPRRGLLSRLLQQPVTSVADAIVPPLVDAVNLDQTLGRVDLDELLQRVDVDELVQRVDVDGVVQKIDIDALLRRVDIDALLERVDVNALAQRINVDALVKQVQLGSVVTQSTKGALGSLLDLIRRQVVGIDVVILEFFARLRHRKEYELTGPPLLAGASGAVSPNGRESVSGRYAGPFSRLLAFALDVVVVVATFAGGVALFTYVVSLLTGHEFTRRGGTHLWWIVVLAVWFLLYTWAGLSLAGRTVGKAIVGLRVLKSDGTPMAQRQSFLRVVLLPFNVVLLGLGFFIGVVGAKRQALHDRLIGTCVVYDWGDRKAELPGPLTRWLSGKGAMGASLMSSQTTTDHLQAVPGSQVTGNGATTTPHPSGAEAQAGTG